MVTGFTKMYLHLAREGHLTIEEAVTFLEREAKPRTFSEILERFCPDGNGKSILVRGLEDHHRELEPGSALRRVRGWFTGEHSVRKKDAIELCFILGLDPDQAEEFIALLSGECLHWRDPYDIVILFALSEKYSYRKTMKLMKKVEDLGAGRKTEITLQAFPFTSLVKMNVKDIRTEKELLSYLDQYSWQLGKFHNNAYNLFMQRLSILENPEPLYEDGKREDYTIRDILREYMLSDEVTYVRNLARKTRKGDLSPGEGLILSTVQKSVVRNWPDEEGLSRIKNRRTDVTRKALILLLMATEKGFVEDSDPFGDPPSREDVFDDIYGRLNQTLEDCGFTQLDSRNPFDWMILYSICVQDMSEVDQRMQNLFQRMFGTNGS